MSVGLERPRLLPELRRHRWLLALAILVVLCIASTVLQPKFLRLAVIESNLTSFLPLILVAIGQTYVILAADIDLSVGSIIAVVNVSVVQLIILLGGDGMAIPAAMLAGIAIGIGCGAVNGLCVAYLRFQPIVTTFATAIVFSGVALWILPQAGGSVPESYWRGYAGDVLGLRLSVWIIAAALAAVLLIARTVWYRRLLATGGNLLGSYQTGLPVMRLRLSAYIVSGVFAALAALCLVGETASADPLLGPSFTLSAVSAVVLGGTALAGGVGGAVGSILGAIILGLIANVVFFAGLPYEYQDLAKGLIVLAALAGGVLVARR
jgi:ribose transport system permease protein